MGSLGRHVALLTLYINVQVVGTPKQTGVQEAVGEDFYSDAYDNITVPTVTVGSNVSDFEVSHSTDSLTSRVTRPPVTSCRMVMSCIYDARRLTDGRRRSWIPRTS